MYRFFPASIELRQESFLWATDLSTSDFCLNLPFKIPFYGNHIIYLHIFSKYIYIHAHEQLHDTQYEQRNGVANEDYDVRNACYVAVLFNNFSAGLTYYFFLSNIITYGQQFIIKKFFINEAALHAQIQEKQEKTG